MIVKIKMLVSIVLLCYITACTGKNKQIPLTAGFQLGKISIIHTKKVIDNTGELTLMTRFKLDKKIGGEMSNYFQYQLGKKIKLVIEDDTLAPVLFYYLPLISENEKEIDVKFLITAANSDKKKQIIFDDSILDFNKINISFK